MLFFATQLSPVQQFSFSQSISLQVRLTWSERERKRPNENAKGFATKQRRQTHHSLSLRWQLNLKHQDESKSMLYLPSISPEMEQNSGKCIAISCFVRLISCLTNYSADLCLSSGSPGEQVANLCSSLWELPVWNVLRFAGSPMIVSRPKLTELREKCVFVWTNMNNTSHRPLPARPFLGRQFVYLISDHLSGW